MEDSFLKSVLFKSYAPLSFAHDRIVKLTPSNSPLWPKTVQFKLPVGDLRRPKIYTGFLRENIVMVSKLSEVFLILNLSIHHVGILNSKKRIRSGFEKYKSDTIKWLSIRPSGKNDVYITTNMI